MCSSRLRAALAAMSFSILGAASAHALAQQKNDALRTPAEPATAPYAVRERLARQVSNGCTYLATLQGTLRPRTDGGDDGRGPNLYAPMLVVSAEVECGHGVLHHVEPTRIDGPRYTKSELENAITAAARVNVDTAGQICSYNPDVSVEGTNVSLRSVRESCRRDQPTPQPPR